MLSSGFTIYQFISLVVAVIIFFKQKADSIKHVNSCTQMEELNKQDFIENRLTITIVVPIVTEVF